MPKHKMITKSCQKCASQVPVACKACPCGHPFLTGQRRAGSSSDSKDEGAVQRRRTERVKREKPNYYDALEYDKQQKKQRKRNRSSTEEHVEPVEDDSLHLKKKRKRTVKIEREPEEDTIVSTLSPEKGYKCSLILSEINRKICLTSWKV